MTLVGTTNANGNFGGGVRVTAPGSQQQGDLLIGVVGANGTASVWTGPAGWTVGANGGSPDSQALRWWWYVVPASPATSYVFTSTGYTDGGVVVIDLRGASGAAPIQGVSALNANDAGGIGNVTSAVCAAVTWSGSTNVVDLLLTSWQPTGATITWPAGFSQMATATDTYGFVAVAGNLTTQAGSNLAPQTATYSVSQAVIPTLQVAIKVGP